MYSALLAKTCGITCPYEATIAFAENAAHNGVQFQFNTKVLKIKRLESGFELLTTQGSIFTKTVLNAAGLFADEMNNMVSDRKLKITLERANIC